MIPFAPFEPDRSKFNAAASEGTLNVLPAADGWKGMPQLNEVSASLGDECLGYVKVQDSNDNLTIIAGTRTDLYKLNTATSPYSWTNIKTKIWHNASRLFEAVRRARRCLRHLRIRGIQKFTRQIVRRSQSRNR